MATLTLAAGLSPELASCWAQAVAGDAEADEFIAFVDAVTEGAVIRRADMLALADRVENLLGTARTRNRSARPRWCCTATQRSASGSVRSSSVLSAETDA